MHRSELIGDIASALSSVQAQVKPLVKATLNTYYKSKYATLDDLIEVLKEPFAQHGLSFSQFPGTIKSYKEEHLNEEGVTIVSYRYTIELTTILMHSSGQFLEQTCEFPIGKFDPQGGGISITYARRYALQSVAGIAAEEDDDGNAASGKLAEGPLTTKPQPKHTPAPRQGNKQPSKKEDPRGDFVEGIFRSGIRKEDASSRCTIEVKGREYGFTCATLPQELAEESEWVNFTNRKCLFKADRATMTLTDIMFHKVSEVEGGDD